MKDYLLIGGHFHGRAVSLQAPLQFLKLIEPPGTRVSDSHHFQPDALFVKEHRYTLDMLRIGQHDFLFYVDTTGPTRRTPEEALRHLLETVTHEAEHAP